MKSRTNLLNGPILPALSGLALPIMATSFIQMAYNLTDMLWIGRLGSGAVASVGAAGMFMWFSNGLATLAKMGGQIKTAQALGANKLKEAQAYAAAAFRLAMIFALAFGIIAVLFGHMMIGFFHLQSAKVVADAQNYLYVTCGLVIFSFLNQIYTGILTAAGNSRASFAATTLGLLLNIILDPLLIFGFGIIPALGVLGAGIATVSAQAVVTLLFRLIVRADDGVFAQLHYWGPISKTHGREIVRIGLPTAIHTMLFSCISMVLARLIADWGDGAVAVQKVGSQIESISWMTAEGYAAALNSFVAQNYGADNPQRIYQGFRLSMMLMLGWGIVCSTVLIVFPHLIFHIFIQEANVLPLGVDYLRILGISQLFMCLEITTAGAFEGLGKTLPPSIVSVLFTAARIPMALFLQTIWGLNGVWWSITISSIIKGIVLFTWFCITLSKDPFFHREQSA